MRHPQVYHNKLFVFFRLVDVVCVNFTNKMPQCISFVFSPLMVSVDCVAVNLWYNEQFDD